MPSISAGLMLYRYVDGDPSPARAQPQVLRETRSNSQGPSLNGQLQVFLGHPGGPFWKNRDAGAWSIPKGLVLADEEPLAAACREFAEETGHRPTGDFLPLGTIRQKSGKMVHAWACQGDLDPASAVSNTFPLEWPPRSGRQIEVPEIDRCDWFFLDEAREKINPAQAELIDRLVALLATAD